MSRGRRASWDCEWRNETVSKDWACGGLSAVERRSLSRTLDRIRLGYSPFDTEIQVPRRNRPYRTPHDSIPHMAGQDVMYGYTRTIDHSPG